MVKQQHPKRDKSIIVIPARMASKRLPGKPMLTAAGKPLVQWTYERAKESGADHVIVATGDPEIADHCQRVGMTWMLTEADHQNGTSRVAEVFAQLLPEMQEQVSTVVNWQVDEPLVEPYDARALMAGRVASIGTLVCAKIPTVIDAPSGFWPRKIERPGITNVVWSNNRCPWFSRAPMQGAGCHVGLYSFSPFLLQTASLLIPSRLALAESLEQLTWLEAGFHLRPVEVAKLPLSINTPEDWTEFKRLKEQEN